MLVAAPIDASREAEKDSARKMGDYALQLYAQMRHIFRHEHVQTILCRNSIEHCGALTVSLIGDIGSK